MATCDTRWWTLMYGRSCGPVVVETTNEDRGPARREGPLEIVDRLAAGLYVPKA